MKIDPSEHACRRWRVHTLAPDFEVLDVWRFDLGAEPPMLDDVLACFWSVFRQLSDSRLARTRLTVGRWMKWDDHDFTLPIPGCQEHSLQERLSAEDRGASRAPLDAPSPVATPMLRTVYQLADEALFETSNDTIHALLHVGIVDGGATLAVYIKSRGLFSRAYMAAIGPARHLVIYPALTRKLEAAWRADSHRAGS